MVRLDLAQEAPGPTRDVEQPRGPASGQSRLEGHERLAPHGGGSTAEQHLNLMVVALGRGAAQITVALKMEFLQIIARISAAWHLTQTALLARTVPPSLDGAQVSEEIGDAAQRLERAAELVRRGKVIPCLDVAPILLDQSPEIPDDAPLVRHRAAAQRLR